MAKRKKSTCERLTTGRMNRSRRRELGWRVAASDPGLTIVQPQRRRNRRRYRVKASREEVARSLEGNWRADVLFELQQAVDSYHFAHRQMLECDEKPQLYLVSLPVR